MWYAGQFLIASPYMLDPNFHRTVVLMVKHGEHGAMGLVINRPLDKLLKDLWEEITGTACDSEEPVHVGGPVPSSFMAVHTDAELSEGTIIPGLYLATSKSSIDQLVNQRYHKYKVFVGHSGWGPNQLEREMEAGAWLTLPATQEHVFSDPGEIWSLAAHAVGRRLLTESLGLRRFPRHPRLN